MNYDPSIPQSPNLIRAVNEDGVYFDSKTVKRFFQFCKSELILRVGRKALQPLVLYPWQQYVCGTLLGWKRPETGLRWHDSAYITVPARSGKNVIIEALALWMLVCDGEQGPYVVAGSAQSKKQGDRIYQGLEFQIKHNNKLKERLVCKPSDSTIKHPKKSGMFEVVCAGPVGADYVQGSSIHCAILDEVHLFTGNRAELYRAMLTRSSDRAQPLNPLVVTTAGVNKTSIGYHLYTVAKKILKGELPLSRQFCLIAEADYGCPIDDENQWKKAQVSWPDGGTGLQLCREMAEKAKHSRTAELEFKQQVLNQWSQPFNRFIDMDKWDACAIQSEEIKGKWTGHEREYPEFPAGTVIYLGCDLSRKLDLQCLTGVVVHEDKYYVLHWAWTPDASTHAENNSRYGEFKDKGLEMTPGTASDQMRVLDTIRDLAKHYSIGQVTVEGREAHLLMQMLMQEGFPVKDANPGYPFYTEPTKRLEALILDEKIVHDGAEICRWQMGNMQIKSDGQGRIMPCKQKSPDKIDFCIALSLAIYGALTHQDKPPEDYDWFLSQPLYI